MTGTPDPHCRPPKVWKNLAEMEAEARMCEVGVNQAQIGEIVKQARKMLLRRDEIIYHRLIGMVWAMRSLGYDVTGRLLEQARFAFAEESPANGG